MSVDQEEHNLKNEEIPEDLGIVMATKSEALWIEVAKKCRSTIENCEKELEIQREFLETAERIIAAEKQKREAHI